MEFIAALIWIGGQFFQVAVVLKVIEGIGKLLGWDVQPPPKQPHVSPGERFENATIYKGGYVIRQTVDKDWKITNHIEKLPEMQEALKVQPQTKDVPQISTGAGVGIILFAVLLFFVVLLVAARPI